MISPKAIQFMRTRLLAKRSNDITIQELSNLLLNADINDSRKLVKAIRAGNVAGAGRILTDIVEEKFKMDVKLEVDTIIADGVLSTEDINKIFK